MIDDLAALAPNLASLGWDDKLDRWAEKYSGGVSGRIARAHRGFCLVFTGDGKAILAASSSIRVTTKQSPATGDFVVVDNDYAEGPSITAIADRRSALTRRAPGRTPEPQVLATNSEYVWVMESLDTPLNKRRLERLLVMSWESKAQPVVVLTKSDNVDDSDTTVESVKLIAPETPVVTISTTAHKGLGALSEWAKTGMTVALLGPSGIGKSTLVNALSGGAVQRTGEVRATDRKGRHTTATRDLIPLPDGGVLIDTPGIREIGLWQSFTGLAKTFPEIDKAQADCQFSDCFHENEPNCGVTKARNAGLIENRRLDHWKDLSSELTLQDTQLEEFGRRASSRRKIKAVDRQARKRNR